MLSSASLQKNQFSAQQNSHWREARKYPPQAGTDVSQHLAHILRRGHPHGHAGLLSFHNHLQEPGGTLLNNDSNSLNFSF